MSKVVYIVLSWHLTQVTWSEDFYFWDKAAQSLNNGKEKYFVY